MMIIGIDFTSSPRPSKPITVALGNIKQSILEIKQFKQLETFGEFEKLLEGKGPWVAGIDFPFGQPTKLINNLDWPRKWKTYVRKVAGMTMEEFEQVLTEYRKKRTKGDKQHLRKTDELARSKSPMMLYGVPVARMFFRGAPLLLKSPASILPCCPMRDSRMILEAYPALVARRFAGGQGYKTEAPNRDTSARKQARSQIIAGIQSTELNTAFTLSLNLEAVDVGILQSDHKGDTLDAVLCAIQAASAYQRREENFGIPKNCNKDEGWIVDPSVQSA